MPPSNEPENRREGLIPDQEGNWLYAATAKAFIETARDGEVLATILQSRHLALIGDSPSQSEIDSWRHSLPVMAHLFEAIHLQDQFIILEYCPPSRDQFPNRVDMMICGLDENHHMNAVILELKQWADISMKHSTPGFLNLYQGKRWKKHRHPRAQAEDYRRHMKSVFTACDLPEDFLRLSAYAFLHNAMNLSYSKKNVLFASYHVFDEDSRLYRAEFAPALLQRIRERVGRGRGDLVLAALNEVQDRAIANISKLPKRPTPPPRTRLVIRRSWRNSWLWFMAKQCIALFLFIFIFLIIVLTALFFAFHI